MTRSGLAGWMLRASTRLVPEDFRDSVLGDLQEEADFGGAGRGTGWMITRMLSITLLLRWDRARSRFVGMGSRPPTDRGSNGRGSMIDTLLNDLRYGVRMLAKNPGFTTVAVGCLAVGMGASTAMFSLVNAVLLRPLPVEQPDRLVRLWQTRDGILRGQIAYSSYEFYRDNNDSFTGLTTQSPAIVNVSGGDRSTRVYGAVVTGNYFSLLGVRPALGRGFLPEEDQTPGTHPVAVISHGLWQRHFGASPEIVGESLILNGHPFTVVGVAPAGFTGIRIGVQFDVWVPLAMSAQLRPRRDRAFGIWLAGLIGRLEPGVSLEQAQAEMTTLARQLEQARPVENKGIGILVVPEIRHNQYNMAFYRKFAAFIMGAVALVMLIACANVATMLLARSMARRQEIAIRLALGASRGRLIRQLLSECALLAAAASALGLAFGYWGAKMLLRPLLMSGWIGTTLDVTPDGRVLGFTLVTALLTVILFGLTPAMRASRPSLIPALKNSTTTGRERRSRLRDLLVASQVGLSLVLLIGAGLFVRSAHHLSEIDPGFDADRVLMAPIDLATQGYDETRARAFYEELRERLEAIPGVEAVSLAFRDPATFGSASSGRGAPLLTPLVEGQEPAPEERRKRVPFALVASDHFRTMGIPLLLGRDFSAADRAADASVIIVTETMARHFWPGENPVGSRLTISAARSDFNFVGRTAEVVGVAKDRPINFYPIYGYVHKDLENPEPLIYLPLYWHPDAGIEFVLWPHIRTAGDPVAAGVAFRQQVAAIDEHLPPLEVMTAAESIRLSFGVQRILVIFSGSLGALALLLAATGVYGVMSHSASQRTHEIGIRMALGAQSRDVLALVMREGMVTILMGVAIGVGAALGVTRLMASLLSGVTATDPATFAAVTVGLTGVALLACYIPTRRAMKVDPLVALRSE